MGEVVTWLEFCRHRATKLIGAVILYQEQLGDKDSEWLDNYMAKLRDTTGPLTLTEVKEWYRTKRGWNEKG